MNLKRWCPVLAVIGSLVCACVGDGEDEKAGNGNVPVGSAARQVCDQYCMTADCSASYCTSAARRACEAYCDAEDHCDASTEVTDCYDYQCNHLVLPMDSEACQAATKAYYDCMKGIAPSCAEGCDAEGT